MTVPAEFDPSQSVQGVPDFATTSLFGIDAGVAQAPVTIGGFGRVNPAGPAYQFPDANLGSQPSTLGEAAQIPWHLPPGSDELKNFQQDLFDAGLYPDSYYRAKNPTKLNLGVMDDVDANAWKGITVNAARSGRSVQDLLEERKAMYAQQGGVGAAKTAEAKGAQAPFSPQVANPLTLTEVAQKAAEATLGRGFSQAELDKFVKNYQAMQVNAQQGDYNASISGGTSTAAPDPTAAATAQARQSAPTEAYANDLMNVYDKAMAFLTRKPAAQAGG